MSWALRGDKILHWDIWKYILQPHSPSCGQIPKLLSVITFSVPPPRSGDSDRHTYRFPSLRCALPALHLLAGPGHDPASGWDVGSQDVKTEGC